MRRRLLSICVMFCAALLGVQSAAAQVDLPLDQFKPSQPKSSSAHQPARPNGKSLQRHPEADGPRKKGDEQSGASWYSYSFGDGQGGRGYAAGYSSFRTWTESALPGEADKTPADTDEKAHSMRITSPAISTAQAARCEKAIMEGDAQFAKKKYLAAVERYRAASRIAPQLAKPYMRAGLALVAHGNYAGAARAFQRGLELPGAVADQQSTLQEICGPEILNASNARLADKLRSAPQDGNLLVSMGMQLFYSGELDRAAQYLQQAAGLGIIDGKRVDVLLATAAPAHEATPDEPPGEPLN